MKLDDVVYVVLVSCLSMACDPKERGVASGSTPQPEERATQAPDVKALEPGERIPIERLEGAPTGLTLEGQRFYDGFHFSHLGRDYAFTLSGTPGPRDVISMSGGKTNGEDGVRLAFEFRERKAGDSSYRVIWTHEQGGDIGCVGAVDATLIARVWNPLDEEYSKADERGAKRAREHDERKQRALDELRTHIESVQQRRDDIKSDEYAQLKTRGEKNELWHDLNDDYKKSLLRLDMLKRDIKRSNANAKAPERAPSLAVMAITSCAIPSPEHLDRPGVVLLASYGGRRHSSSGLFASGAQIEDATVRAKVEDLYREYRDLID